MSNPVFKLFFKLTLLALPFVLLFVWYAPHAETPGTLQTKALQNKIEQLVLTSPAPDLIVAGESRALYSVVPEVLTSKTNRSSVNIAVGGATLSQVYDALNTNNALNKKRLIVVSVSSYEINDAFPDNLPIYKKIIANEPWGTGKIRDTYGYYSRILPGVFDHFKKFVRGKGSNTSDNTTFTYGGYYPSEGIFNPASMAAIETYDWYSTIRTKGVREAELLRAIKGFGSTNDIIVIYNGPMAPSWKKHLEGTVGAAAEKHFAQVLLEAIRPYPNLYFIDFRDRELPALSDQEFGDGTHLNKTGAPIFSAILADELRAQKLIK